MKRESDGRNRIAAWVIVPGLLLAACSPAGRGTGAIQNGDFETGGIGPWAPFQAVKAAVDSGHARGGKFGLSETDAAGSVYQDVEGLKTGTGYTVSAWVSGSPGATATAQIAVYDAVRNAATFSPSLKPSETWQQLQYSFQTSSDGPVRIHLFRNTGAGAVYWDDVTIAERT